MLGRRLDRYVTSFFLWHLVLCLVGVLGLYIVVDTFAKLDEFVEYEETAEQIRVVARYHLYQIPVLVNLFLPTIVLLAGIISLARLASYNELNAMKAVGVSLYRTLAPVFLCTIAVGALAAANQEYLLPSLEKDINQARAALKPERVKTKLFVYDRAQRTTIWAQELNTRIEGREFGPATATADPEIAPDGKPYDIGTIEAKDAVWVDHWLFLFNGKTTAVLAKDKERPFAVRMLWTEQAAIDFDPHGAPNGKLADGTPAHEIRAKADLPALTFSPPLPPAEPGGPVLDGPTFQDPHEGRSYTVRFASVRLFGRYEVLFDGQLTEAFAGTETRPPTAVLAALWRNGRWLARAQTYIEKGRGTGPSRRKLIVYDGQPLPIASSPTQLLYVKTDPSLKSYADLTALGRELAALKQRIGVLLHARLAFPFASLVLLLVAIPLLFQQEGGRGTWIGVGLALLVSLAFYFVTYFCQFVGRDPTGVFRGIAWVAAWLPIALFALAGLVLMARMKT